MSVRTILLQQCLQVNLIKCTSVHFSFFFKSQCFFTVCFFFNKKNLKTQPTHLLRLLPACLALRKSSQTSLTTSVRRATTTQWRAFSSPLRKKRSAISSTRRPHLASARCRSSLSATSRSPASPTELACRAGRSIYLPMLDC